MNINSGASFVGITFKVVCFVVVYTPSVTVVINILLPFSFWAGFKLNVLIVPELPSLISNEIESDGNNVGFVFTYPTIKLSSSS